MLSLRFFRPFFLLCALLLMTGCGTQPNTAALHPQTGGVSGDIHGGQPPVVGATVQLYAVGTTGDGSSATPVLTTPATSDGNGGFVISGPYNCSGSALVYLTATGGNPGVSRTNPNLALMAIVGPCSTLTSSIYVSVNELTTVAAVVALAPYMTSPTAIGSGSGDAAGLAAAFALASELVDMSTGQTPGTNIPAGMTVPVDELNTLANIIASCVASTGGTSGDSSLCGSLFSLSTPAGGTPATNTITALLHIINNPTLNTADLFNLVGANAPFQPQLTAVPEDFHAHLTPAPLLLSPSALSFDPTPLGGTIAQSVTLTNTTAAVPIAGIGINGPSAGDFEQTNTCPATLDKGSLCTIQVTFSPSATTSRAAVLWVNAGGGVTTIPLSGSGVASSAGPVTLSTTTLTFYERGVAQPVTLTNYGTNPLGISAIQFSSPNYTEVNNCGSSLSGQSVCTIYVSAATVPGTFTGTMTVVDSDTTDAQSVALATNADYTGVVNFEVTPIGDDSPNFDSFTGNVYLFTNSGFDFYGFVGDLGPPNAQDFIETNENTTNGCTIREPASTNPSPTSAGCTIEVLLKPFESGPLYSHFTSNMGDNLLLKGYGAGSTPEFLFTQLTLNFADGVVGNTYTQTLQLENASTASVTFTSATPFLTTGPINNNEFSASISSCSGGGVLLPPASDLPSVCDLNITFQPTTIGPRSTTLTVSTTGGLSHSIFLTGNGAYTAPGVPASLSVGNVQTGGSGTVSVPVTLPDHHAATAQITEADSVFAISGSTYCAQGAPTCQFAITFSPSVLGGAQAHLVVTDTVSGLTSTALVTGTGGVPVVSFSPSSLTFLPRSVGSQSIAQALVLTNMGNATLSITSIAPGGTDSGDYGQTNNCPASLDPNASCTISVTNTPTHTGSSSGSIVVVSNSLTSPDAAALSGAGNAPPP